MYASAMTPPCFTYRPLTAADADRTFAVFREAFNEYLARAGQELVPDENDQTPGFLHVLAHDEPRCWGAEREGELVAWGTAILRGDWWFLSSLFVEPEVQGQGVGGELLRRAMKQAPSAATLATVTDTLQPISNALYARRGLLPRVALLGLGGAPQAAASRGPGPGGAARRASTGLEAEPLAAADVPLLESVDARVLGVDRSVDHRFYLGEGGRRGWLFRRAGRPVAYAMYRANGWIGPLASLREEDVAPVLLHVLAELAEAGLEKVKAGVPTSCVAAQQVLWDAGLVPVSTPGLLLASRPFGLLDRYLPASYGMF